VPRSGWFRNQEPILQGYGAAASKPGQPRRKRRGAALTATGAAMILLAGVAIVTFGSAGSRAAPVSAARAAAQQGRPVGPLRVLLVTPAPGAKGVNGAAPVRVRFSAPLAADSLMPTLSPSIAGSWQVEGDTAVFTPASGYFENTRVTLKIPGGPDGMISAGRASAGTGGRLMSSVTRSFTTGSFSTLGLQQMLSQLGYLPHSWTPESKAGIGLSNANAELSAAYQPPVGTFSWTGDYPPDLTDQWKTGSGNMLDVGAVRAFESVTGLTMDGYAGHAVWSDLLSAVANGKRNPNGYTYALTSQALPETITIWHNGRLVLRSAANTGIPASPTADGTFPVYLRYYFQVMQGTNPDGSQYADPVYYVSYFDGGDAVHYFSRGDYGYNQSLGCVELPWDAAKKAYPYLTYGSLVTVTGPVGD
jgi:peptidoglycan hydrolase-like protein with peptidoglycan-binding domain